jgi:hypothetical protein
MSESSVLHILERLKAGPRKHIPPMPATAMEKLVNFHITALENTGLLSRGMSQKFLARYAMAEDDRTAIFFALAPKYGTLKL